MNINLIQNLTFYSNDLKQDISVKEFLKEILNTFWEKGEGFNSKRPFGSGSYRYDIVEMFIKNEIISGKLDSDGCVIEYNDEEFDDIIFEIIDGF